MHECNCKVVPTVRKKFLSDRRLAASQGFPISIFYGRSYLQNCFYGSKNIQCEQPKEPWADICCLYIISISESFFCMSLAQFQIGGYKSRTGSTRTASPGRINSDPLGPPVRVGSTRIDLDQLGSNKKIKKNKIGLGSTRIFKKKKQLGL